MGWIQTYTGRVFYPTAPRAEDVVLADIAHALAHLCRFTGHCRRFYSVAEHSVWVSRMVPPQYALWGLLHDAAEAYLADVARPVKPLLAGLEEIEARLLRVIARRFRLRPAESIPPAVQDADLRMLETERRQLMAGGQREWELGVEPYEIVLVGLGPGVAERVFLRRFQEVGVRETRASGARAGGCTGAARAGGDGTSEAEAGDPGADARAPLAFRRGVQDDRPRSNPLRWTPRAPPWGRETPIPGRPRQAMTARRGGSNATVADCGPSRGEEKGMSYELAQIQFDGRQVVLGYLETNPNGARQQMVLQCEEAPWPGRGRPRVCLSRVHRRQEERPATEPPAAPGAGRRAPGNAGGRSRDRRDGVTERPNLVLTVSVERQPQ